MRDNNNPFDYIQPRNFEPYGITTEPGLASPTTLTQPSVPINRAEKERAQCAANFVQTAADVTAPPQPIRQRVNWRDTTNRAPMEFLLTRSRTSMLSEKIARQG